MKIFGLKNCDKCRAAQKALSAECIFDIKKNPIPTSILKEAYETYGAALLNRNSTTWRSLNLSERDQDQLSLMKKYPTLIKRPLIKTEDGRLFSGWNDRIKETIFS